jgi:hypothetical protein
MNFADYFIKGLRNTLRLKSGLNWSVKGSEIPIPAATEIDTWFVGEFSNAVYEIVAEYGKHDVEHITVKISARPEQVSVTTSGRSNNGKDLVSISASVDASKVTVIASPFFEIDGITPLSNVKLFFKVTYFERLTPIVIPTQEGESSSLGGEHGINQNWKNTNVPDGFITLSNTGSILISNVNRVQVPGQPELVSDFILSRLIVANTDDSITITTTPNSLTFSLDSIANLNVATSFTANTNLVSTVNNVVFGGSTPLAGTFTQLTVTSALSATSNNQQITLSPSGTGTVTISPGTAGSINNVTIGATSARAIVSTNLAVNSTVQLTSNNQTISMQPTGTGTVTINPANPGSIDNVTIGLTTPSTGRFTNITILSPSTTGNQLITLGQLQAILLGAAV